MCFIDMARNIKTDGISTISGAYIAQGAVAFTGLRSGSKNR